MGDKDMKEVKISLNWGPEHVQRRWIEAGRLPGGRKIYVRRPLWSQIWDHKAPPIVRFELDDRGNPVAAELRGDRFPAPVKFIHREPAGGPSSMSWVRRKVWAFGPDLSVGDIPTDNELHNAGLL